MERLFVDSLVCQYLSVSLFAFMCTLLGIWEIQQCDFQLTCVFALWSTMFISVWSYTAVIHKIVCPLVYFVFLPNGFISEHGHNWPNELFHVSRGPDGWEEHTPASTSPHLCTGFGNTAAMAANYYDAAESLKTFFPHLISKL